MRHGGAAQLWPHCYPGKLLLLDSKRGLVLCHALSLPFHTALIMPHRGMLTGIPRRIGALRGSDSIIGDHSPGWVAVGDCVRGFVVAVRQDLPWDYVTPMQDALHDVKRTLRTEQIRIPTPNEVEQVSEICAKWL